MATAAENLVALEAAYADRINGGLVEQYSLPDGTQVRLSSMAEFLKARDALRLEARQEASTQQPLCSRARFGRVR